MRYPWTLALLMVAFLAISISAANQHDVRLVCSVGYKPCKPYAFDVGPLLEPIEGSAIAKMYVDSIRSLGGQSRSISQVQQFVNVLGYEDQAEPVCCTQSSLCAIVTQLDVPYCYDRRTSDFFFPDGSYGSVSVGNVTISNGNGGNLATGEYVLKNGTRGNVYTADGPWHTPRRSSLDRIINSTSVTTPYHWI